MKPPLTIFGIALALMLSGTLVGCNKSQPSESDNSAALQPAAASSAIPSASSNNVPKPNLDGNKIMQYTKEVVAFGSRPPGSPAHVKLEQYIVSQLKGVEVEQDKFTAQTPAGQFPVNNIIAKFPGKKNGIIVVAGH
jgi:hypothetical protein